MSEDYGCDYITIEDEEGNEFDLELILSTDYKGTEYSLFLPADMPEDDPDYGYIILRRVTEDGEDLFVSLDDDDELVIVYDIFMDLLFKDEEAAEEKDDIFDE